MRLKNQCNVTRHLREQAVNLPNLDYDKRAKGDLVNKFANDIRKRLLENIEAYKIEDTPPHPYGDEIYEIDYVIMKTPEFVKLLKTISGVLDLLGLNPKDKKFIEDFFIEATSKEI